MINQRSKINEQSVDINFLKRYIFALSLIAILASLAFYTLLLALKASESTALIVNMSGKQRMLSQKIASYSQRYIKSVQIGNSSDTEMIKTTLLDAINEMHNANEHLASGQLTIDTIVKLSPETHELYFERLHIKQRVDDYLELAKKILADPTNAHSNKLILELERMSDSILPHLNVIVAQYQKEGEKRIQQITTFELFAWIATIFTLLIEAIFIFQPMAKKIKEYFINEKLQKNNLEHEVQNRTSHLEIANQKLIHSATHDQLTGLPNRQKIVFDIEKNNPTACVIFNVDDFKEINDFFGIKAGDDILNQMGQWFVEKNFFPYRIGGDEFAILFYENIAWGALRHKIEIILFSVEENTFYINNSSINVRMTAGASIGFDRLLTRADIALNRAREHKIHIARYEEDENIEETYRKNMAMEDTIRKALVEKRIICHYQPIVNTETGDIHKYETLVRMLDEEGNLIAPMEFLPIAKKTKFYPRITAEVISQACSLFSTRNEEFSVNLSVSDILNQTTKQQIIDTIIQTDTASQIVFEILESEGIENYNEVAKFIDEVKALGAKIAIDDFGTGYSNFENILKLNVDYIKIDGSLIREINTNSRHHIIVETIVDFAKKIGAKTIAEFVSNEEIFNIIKGLGIDFSQGYFTGRPKNYIDRG